MPEIARTARITITRKDFPHLASVTPLSPLEDKVHLIWAAAHRMATLSGGVAERYNGKPGVRGHFTMTQVVSSVFPELSRDDVAKLSSASNQVLRRCNGAHCQNSGKGIVSTWWVADEIPDDMVVIAQWVASRGKLSVAPPLAPTRTEVKLTPHEAGEDREPAPVTVTKKPKPDPNAALLEALSGDQPLTYREAAAAIGANANSMNSKLIRLEERGLVHSRMETRNERAVRAGVDPSAQFPSRNAKLWSTRNPVPPRTVREVVPGVTIEPTFSSAFGRPATAGVKLSAEDARDQVLALLLGADDYLSTGDIEKAVSGSHGVVWRAIQQLLKLGLIVDDAAGRKAGQRSQYRAADKAFGTPAPAPAPAPAPKPTPAPAPKPTPADSPAARVVALKEENTRLRARVAELEAELATIAAALG